MSYPKVEEAMTALERAGKKTGFWIEHSKNVAKAAQLIS